MRESQLFVVDGRRVMPHLSVAFQTSDTAPSAMPKVTVVWLATVAGTLLCLEARCRGRPELHVAVLRLAVTLLLLIPLQ